MARSVNKHIIVGNVGDDPVVRYTGSGIAVATFSIATSEQYEKDGEKKESTQWHKCVVWRKLAEIVGEYVKKGSRLYVEGKVTYRTYDDKENVKRYVTEIVVDELVMLDSRKSDDAPVAGSPAASVTKDDDSSLPF